MDEARTVLYSLGSNRGEGRQSWADEFGDGDGSGMPTRVTEGMSRRLK